MRPDLPQAQRFVAEIRCNRFNRAILDAWSELRLPAGWLVAGCLFQTIWNLQSGRAPEADIKDYDLFYFDAGDLSAQAEERVQQRVDAILGPLGVGVGVAVEAKNQARVHLWYEAFFGFPYPQLASASEGIDRFLIPATCVGVQPAPGGYRVHVPNGFDILYAGELTPNPLTPHLPLFRAKAASYQRRWPWLRVRE